MHDDPRRNLKWMEQQLLEEEHTQDFLTEDQELMRRVDALIGEEKPAGSFNRKSKGAQAERTHINAQFDPSAAVLTKTRRQLRREAKQKKLAQKKTSVNRNIKGLVFLAILEVCGILAILGWWLQ